MYFLIENKTYHIFILFSIFICFSFFLFFFSFLLLLLFCFVLSCFDICFVLLCFVLFWYLFLFVLFCFLFLLIFWLTEKTYEKFEDTKMLIRNRKLKKVRQCSGHKKNYQLDNRHPAQNRNELVWPWRDNLLNIPKQWNYTQHEYFKIVCFKDVLGSECPSGKMVETIYVSP